MVGSIAAADGLTLSSVRWIRRQHPLFKSTNRKYLKAVCSIWSACVIYILCYAMRNSMWLPNQQTIYAYLSNIFIFYLVHCCCLLCLMIKSFRFFKHIRHSVPSMFKNIMLRIILYNFFAVVVVVGEIVWLCANRRFMTSCGKIYSTHTKKAS